MILPRESALSSSEISAVFQLILESARRDLDEALLLLFECGGDGQCVFASLRTALIALGLLEPSVSTQALRKRIVAFGSREELLARGWRAEAARDVRQLRTIGQLDDESTRRLGGCSSADEEEHVGAEIWSRIMLRPTTYAGKYVLTVAAAIFGLRVRTWIGGRHADSGEPRVWPAYTIEPDAFAAAPPIVAEVYLAIHSAHHCRLMAVGGDKAASQPAGSVTHGGAHARLVHFASSPSNATAAEQPSRSDCRPASGDGSSQPAASGTAAAVPPRLAARGTPKQARKVRFAEGKRPTLGARRRIGVDPHSSVAVARVPASGILTMDDALALACSGTISFARVVDEASLRLAIQSGAIIVVLFAGPPRLDDGLAACAARLAARVLPIDTLIDARGHDMMQGHVNDALTFIADAGIVASCFAAIPCSSCSRARFRGCAFDARDALKPIEIFDGGCTVDNRLRRTCWVEPPADRSDVIVHVEQRHDGKVYLRSGACIPNSYTGYAPPLRDVDFPDGLPAVTERGGHLALFEPLLRMHNELITRSVALLRVVAANGGAVCIENPPPDPGEPRHASLFHVSAVRQLIDELDLEHLDFQQGAVGATKHKPTRLAFSTALAHGLSPLSKLPSCSTPQPQLDGEGDDGYSSLDTAVMAKYPARMNWILAEALSGAETSPMPTSFQPVAPPPVASLRGAPALIPTAAADATMRDAPPTPCFSAPPFVALDECAAGMVAVAVLVWHTERDTLVAVPAVLGSLVGCKLIDAQSRDATETIAEGWLRAVSGDFDTLVDMGGTLAIGNVTVRIMHAEIAGALDAEPPALATGMWWRHTTAIEHEGCREVCEMAALSVAAWVRPGAALPAKLRVGSTGTKRVASDLAATAERCSFQERLDWARQGERELTRALRSFECSDEGLLKFLGEFADRITPPQLEDVPEPLRNMSLSFADPSLRLKPFSHRSGIPASVPPRPPLPPVQFPGGVAPQCDEEYFNADFLEAYDAFEASYHAWHRAKLRREPWALDPGSRPDSFAWRFEDAVQPKYHECPADFRGGPGNIVPLDLTQPAIELPFDAQAMAEELGLLPDGELVSAWCNGVSFKAGTPMWIIVHPNLLSMYDGTELIAKEFQDFYERGWFVSSVTGPNGTRCRFNTAPGIGNPKGGVKKKLGSAPRCITEMGASRKLLYDGKHGRYLAPVVNARAGPVCPPKYPVKDVKPTAGEAGCNSAILMHIAEPNWLWVFELGWDFFKYYHQFVYLMDTAILDQCMVPLLEPLLDSGGKHFTAEHLSRFISGVMAMGGTPASLYAQCGSNSIVGRLLMKMDEAEKEFAPLENDNVRSWLRDRAVLPHDSYGSQSRLCDILAFADDPRANCVGVKRTVRLLCEVYDLIVRRIGLILSDPAKFNLGMSGVWTGVHFAPMLGIAWFGRAKVIKALNSILAAIDAQLVYDEWHSNVSFLVHIWSLLRRPPYELDESWKALRMHKGGPADKLVPTPECVAELNSAATVISNTPGVSLLKSVKADAAPRVGAACMELVGDAAREEGISDTGFGGHLYQLGSWLPLSQEMFDAFDTPELEFTQAFMLLLTHAKRALRWSEWIMLRADALATPTVLAEGRAKAPAMRQIHHSILKHPIFRMLVAKRALDVGHRYGKGNGVGDDLSRGKFERANRRCVQRGLKLELQPYSDEALQWLDELLALPFFKARIAEAASRRAESGDAATKPAHAEAVARAASVCCGTWQHVNIAPGAHGADAAAPLQPVGHSPPCYDVATDEPFFAAGGDEAPWGPTAFLPRSPESPAACACRNGGSNVCSTPPSRSLATPSSPPSPMQARDLSSPPSTPAPSPTSPFRPRQPGVKALRPSPLLQQRHRPRSLGAVLGLVDSPANVEPAKHSRFAPSPSKLESRGGTAADMLPRSPSTVASAPGISLQLSSAGLPLATTLQLGGASGPHGPLVALAMPIELQAAEKRTALPAGALARAQQITDRAHRFGAALGIAPSNSERLRDQFLMVIRLKQLAAPRNTLNQESSNMKHWYAYAEFMGFDVIRPHVSTLRLLGADAEVVEACLWAAAVPFILARMVEAWTAKPRIDRPYPPKASSALQVLRGVRRHHGKRLEIETVSLATSVQVCEGMLREYLLHHGKEALLPRRKEPFTREMIVKLLGVADNTPLVVTSDKGVDGCIKRLPAGGRTVKRGSLLWDNIFALIATLSQCGFRKAETTVADGEQFSNRNLSWGDIRWRIHAASDKLIACPTPEQLDMLAPGDYLSIRPPPSKSDSLGIHWGNDPIYLPFERDEPICAARLIAALERRRQIKPEARRSTPLFCDGKGAPFKHGPLDAILRLLLPASGACEAADAHKYSWHSFRIYLATALLAIDTPIPMIQALLRWKTAEACAIYARTSEKAYSDLLSSAVRAEFSTIRTANWQVVQNIAHGTDNMAANLERCIEGMYTDAQTADTGGDGDVSDVEY